MLDMLYDISVPAINQHLKKSFDLTILEKGEHWFHTEEQMKFLEAWIIG